MAAVRSGERGINWPGLILRLLLAGGVIAGLMVAATHYRLINWPAQIDYRYLAIPIAAQAAYWLVAAVAWRLTVFAVAGRRLPLGESLVQVVMVLVGKYLPGKVWGMAARVYQLAGHGVGYSQCVQASYLEQLLFAHTGVVLGLGALAMLTGRATPVVLLCLLLAASLPVLPRVHGRLIRGLGRLLARTPLRRWDMAAALSFDLGARAYTRLSGVYFLDWLVTGAVQLGLYLTLFGGPLDPAVGVLIIGAGSIAIVVGFFALFAPGGIGVREGVAVAILVYQVPLADAATLVIVYRLWLVAADALAGLAVLAFRGGTLFVRAR